MAWHFFSFFFSPIAQNIELTTESSNDYETTEDILDFDESDSDCESYQQYDCGSGICIPITKVCDGEKGTSLLRSIGCIVYMLIMN